MPEFRLTNRSESIRLQFRRIGGKWKTISLGRCDYHVAQRVLQGLRRGERRFPDLPPTVHRKLCEAGLCGEMQATDLAGYLERYFVRYCTGMRPNTVRNMSQMVRQLNRFFGPRDVRSITVEDADEWYAWRAKSTAPATLGREVKRIKQVFASAVDYELISLNPFRRLKGGASANPERFEYVSRDIVERVLNACPTQQWRTIIVLARVGGVRVSSDLCNLTWDGVDFRKKRITIPPHKSRLRVIPMWSEIRNELVREPKPMRDGYVIKDCRVKSNLDLGLARILRRAGIKRWPRLWHNLRASRQSELESENVSRTAVCYWMGNSTTVAEQHYLHTLEADFEKAIRMRMR